MSESATHCVCGNEYRVEEPKDGPRNSDIPTECTHWLCFSCWYNRYRKGLRECPICERDVSEWLFSYYSLYCSSNGDHWDTDGEEDE